MKILLATDGSAHSQTMVNELAGRTFAADTQVRIVSAFEGGSYMLNTAPMGTLSRYYAQADSLAIKAAENVTENAAVILRKKNPGLSISVAAIEGSPKSAILEDAETFGADLIVVGSHGHGAVAGFLLGSVSQAVALHAKCSVEIVRNRKTNF